MKNIPILIFFFIAACTTGNAQNLKKIKVSNSIEMSAQRNEVWTTISNLGNLDKVVPEIISQTKTFGNGKGAIVNLTLKANGKTVVEKVRKLSNKKYIFVYKMLETPLPIQNYKATIKIISTSGTKYTVKFDAVFKASIGDKESMITTIDNFQKTLLSNIKKTYDHE